MFSVKSSEISITKRLGLSNVNSSELFLCSNSIVSVPSEVNTVNQRLSYLVRSGQPDALDSIVPMAYGNMALDVILKGKSGLLMTLRKGIYGSAPLEIIVGNKKVIDVEKYYNASRLRPNYHTFIQQPLLIMTSDI